MADPDIQAARVLLLAAWHRLPRAQQTALRRAVPIQGGYKLAHDTPARTRGSLEAKRLAGLLLGQLTPTAILVREVGLEDDAAKAKRRFNRRAHAGEGARQP